MLQQSTGVNVSVRVIENLLKKFDIELKESHKSILTILISGVVFKDGSIIILSESIHQINRIIKKKNEHIDFVSLLLAYNCITHIDMYGAITIPLCVLLEKLRVKKEIIGRVKETHISKKVLTNATQTLIISDMLTLLGIPKIISIPAVNILLEYVSSDLKEDTRTMIQHNVGFKGFKMSETYNVLCKMQLEKVFLSTAILLIIAEIGFKIAPSLILVSILSELYRYFYAEYRMRTAKSFMKAEENIKL
jgi:hypothetical protein